MKRVLIFHPFLFMLNPLLFLFAHNIDQVSASDLIGPLAVGLAATLALLLAVGAIGRDYQKAALISSITIGWFFLYGHVFNVVQPWLPGGTVFGKQLVLEALWLLLLSGGCWLAARTRRSLRNLTSILQVASVALVLLPLLNLAGYGLQNRELWQGGKGQLAGERPAAPAEQASDRHPDVYYIILDAYAHADTLNEVYHYDNSEFINFLADRGFYVAAKSRSNYGMTFLSLASSLNMEYLNGLSSAVGAQSKDQTVPRAMISDNQVSRFFKARGYQVIQFDSGWGPTRRNQAADRLIQTGRQTSYGMMLFQTTVLSPWTRQFFGNGARERVLNHFEKLAEVAALPGPKFVLAHIISPHPPYLFDADGRPVPASPLSLKGRIWLDREKYRDQLIFINQKVKTAVTEILATAETPPVIILQGDHGTASNIYEPGGGGWNRPTPAKIRERFRILNAIHLPAEDQKYLYDTLSPVNIFRLVFNRYFGADYPLLEEKSFFSTYQLPYQFTDVTEQAAFE
jgi:hypothetical protein